MGGPRLLPGGRQGRLTACWAAQDDGLIPTGVVVVVIAPDGGPRSPIVKVLLVVALLLLGPPLIVLQFAGILAVGNAQQGGQSAAHIIDAGKESVAHSAGLIAEAWSQCHFALKNVDGMGMEA